MSEQKPTMPRCSCCGAPMKQLGPRYWICHCGKPWIDPLKRKKEAK